MLTCQRRRERLAAERSTTSHRNSGSSRAAGGEPGGFWPRLDGIRPRARNARDAAGRLDRRLVWLPFPAHHGTPMILLPRIAPLLAPALVAAGLTAQSFNYPDFS